MADDLSSLIKSFQQATADQTAQAQKQTEHINISNMSLEKMSHGIENMSQLRTRADLHMEQANLLQNRMSGTMEKLLMASQTSELGTGKYDSMMHEKLSDLHRDMESNPPLEPTKHGKLLGDIRESLKAGQLTMSEKLDRWFTNNVKVFGSFGDSFKRLFGANIFEQRRRKIIQEQEARTRELEEESYKTSYLQYKLLSTDITNELRMQTNLMEEMLNRTPTDAEREEDEMEARRRRRYEITQSRLRRGRQGDGEDGEDGEGDSGGGLFGWIGSAIMGWLGGKELIRSVRSMGGFKNWGKAKFLGMTTQVAHGTMLTAEQALLHQPGMSGKPPRWSVKDPITKKFITKAKAIQLGLVDDTGKLILNTTDDALKATKGTKGLLDIGKTAKTITSGMKTVAGTALGRVMPIFAGISATIATGKDIFDIHSAMTDDDIRTAVQWEDIGGVAGSIVGGALGFVFGGPAGAALAADLGNTIGGSVGNLFDDPNIKKNLDETLEMMKEKVEKATGVRKEIEEKKLADFEKAIDAERQALMTTDTKMDAKVKEIQLLKEQRDEAAEQGDLYNQALIEAKLIKAESEQDRLNRIRQENVEMLQTAMRETLTAEGIRASEGGSGWLEKIAAGKGALAGFASIFADDDAINQLEGKILAIDALEDDIFEQAEARKIKEMAKIKKDALALQNTWSETEKQTEEGLADYQKKRDALIDKMKQVATMGTALEEAEALVANKLDVMLGTGGFIQQDSIKRANQQNLEALVALLQERDAMQQKMGLGPKAAPPTIIDQAKTVVNNVTKKVSNIVQTGSQEVKLAAQLVKGDN